jgi:predicted dehydrogenase
VAGNRLRIGFIGCGGNARGHGRRITEMQETELVALADVSDAAIAAFKEAVPAAGDVPVFHDYEKMLDLVRLDAVEISTPHTLHYDQIMAALDHGCHVLTEKPMVCSVAHAHDVIRKSRETGRHVMVSYQRHFSPAYSYCRQVVQSGELGPVHFITAHQCQNWYRGQQGKWRMDPVLSGGGQLNDSGSHLIDIILWITGARAKEVFALMENLDAEVDILTAMAVRFDNGALANISVVGHSAGKMREDMTIWMEKGTLFLRGGKVYREEPGTDMQEVPATSLPEGKAPDRAFIDLILGRAENRVPPECGLAVIELTEAAWSSAENGRPVVLSQGSTD